MTEWSEARKLAAQYQSPGWAGRGFAMFASTGKNSQQLWDDIHYHENASDDWVADIDRKSVV
jgi:hypothetical protein